MCLKRLITVPFESSEPLYLLRLMGVLVPSLHIESTYDTALVSLILGIAIPTYFCTSMKIFVLLYVLLRHACTALLEVPDNLCNSSTVVYALQVVHALPV